MLDAQSISQAYLRHQEVLIERIKKDDLLKATKISGRYRIKRQDLDEFINNL